jgi:hypothetical protein
MTAPTSDKTLSVSQVNKKANWVTVSLPRALVRDLRAKAHNLDLSVVKVIELAYKSFDLAHPGFAEPPPPKPRPNKPTRPDAVQVGRFVYPKKG